MSDTDVWWITLTGHSTDPDSLVPLDHSLSRLLQKESFGSGDDPDLPNSLTLPVMPSPSLDGMEVELLSVVVERSASSRPVVYTWEEVLMGVELEKLFPDFL